MKSITIQKGYEFRTIAKDIYNPNDFFYSEYCQAARCIDEIVCESIRFCREHANSVENGYREKSVFMSEQQELRGYPNNVIAFCARRGHGKTSAMLSISKTLEKLPIQDEYENREIKASFWKNAHRNLQERTDEVGKSSDGEFNAGNYRYFVMEPIDPTTMEPNDSIMLNILSRMYHIWNEEQHKKSNFYRNEEKSIFKNLAQAFQDAYRNIYTLKRPFDKTEFDEYDDLTQLAERGDSVNAKNAFSHLVRCFLEYTQKDILVIPVDDADLNTARSYEIVEDVRKYCVGPRILVMMAVHLGTLRTCIEQENVKKYEYLLDRRFEIPHMEGSKCREMAERYIDKLIPGIHQIHLPYVDEWFREERTDVDLYYIFLKRDMNEKLHRIDLLEYDGKLSHNYQHRLFRLIYEKTGIIFMPQKDYLHNFLPRRYRELTHFLSYFCSMEDIQVCGEGSLENLIKTYYGGENIDDSLLEKRQQMLDTRKENLEKMMVYFLQHWCTIVLEKEQTKIILEINGVPLGLKCKKTLDLLSEYCKNLKEKSGKSDLCFYINGEVNFPDYTENASYAQVMEVLGELKKKLNVEHKYEFIYAIQLYFTICMNRCICIHLEKRDGFEELTKMCKGKIFANKYFYKNTNSLENDIVCVQLLRKMYDVKSTSSPAAIGWDTIFTPIQINEDGFTDIQGINILTENDSGGNPESSGSMINPDVEWFRLDVNRALFSIIGRDWVTKHCKWEWDAGNKNAYDGVSNVLQLICNFDFQYRIRKYVLYNLGKDNVDFFSQLLSLCSDIDRISVRDEIENNTREKIESEPRYMEDVPRQELPLSGKIEFAVRELINKNQQPERITAMIKCASPRKCLKIFREITEKVASILQDKNIEDTEYLSDQCERILDEHEDDIAYLCMINAFRLIMNEINDFLKNEDFRTPKKINDLCRQCGTYQNSVKVRSKNKIIKDIALNLNKDNWLTNP